MSGRRTAFEKWWAKYGLRRTLDAPMPEVVRDWSRAAFHAGVRAGRRKAAAKKGETK